MRPRPRLGSRPGAAPGRPPPIRATARLAQPLNFKGFPMSSDTRRRIQVAVEQRPTTGWVGSLRLSAFAFVMLALVVIGVLVLAPGLKTYVEQQQQVAGLQAQVEAAQQQVAELTEERDRWSDPAFVRAQIRERLYYVEPGDYSALVIDDIGMTDVRRPKPPASEQVGETEIAWDAELLRATLVAGLGDPDPDEYGEVADNE